MTTTHAVKLRAKPEGKRAPDGAETMLEEWVARVGGARRPRTTPPAATPAPAPGGETHHGVQAALARVTMDGSLARFDDALGGTVAMARAGARVAHAGSIGTRGPLGLAMEALRGVPMTEAHARGAEFVAAWFGAPQDAVSVEARAEGAARLVWGFWSLGQSELARALSEWKKGDAAAFDAQLGTYGIDVIAPEGDLLAAPKLLVVDPRRGVLRGGRAVALLASDPRRVAVLGRALRDPGARAAQARTLVSWVIAPVFARVVLREDRKVLVGDLVATPRAAAAVLTAARVLDQDALGALLDADASNDDAFLGHVARWLVVHGQKLAAHRVRRILSSPELA